MPGHEGWGEGWCRLGAGEVVDAGRVAGRSRDEDRHLGGRPGYLTATFSIGSVQQIRSTWRADRVVRRPGPLRCRLHGEFSLARWEYLVGKDGEQASIGGVKTARALQDGVAELRPTPTHCRMSGNLSAYPMGCSSSARAPR